MGGNTGIFGLFDTPAYTGNDYYSGVGASNGDAYGGTYGNGGGGFVGSDPFMG